MCKSSMLVSFCFSLVTVVTRLASANADVQALLVKADAYRLAPGAAQVSTQITVYQGDRLDKERHYLVYLKSERRSLVLSKSPIEKGLKVLMLGDDFWMVMPSSQRPIRITPAQKLLGDASTGDIATMTWADDYDGTIVGDVDVEGTACVKLELVAQRHGVTYHRIELYLAKGSAKPVQADLYVASEKLAKKATFELSVVEGRPQVTTMTLIDTIQIGRKTVIRYLSRSSRSIADEFYNPMFLTHHEPD